MTVLIMSHSTVPTPKTQTKLTTAVSQIILNKTMEKLTELLPEQFNHSRLLILDFDQISPDTPKDESIQYFFAKSHEMAINPRKPENRQAFNESVLRKTGARYLIGRYGEDRHSMLADTQIAREGRTIHLGIDIFSENLVPVLAPCDGAVVQADYEEGFGSYGNYVVFQPNGAENLYLFLGHLSSELPEDTASFKRGDAIARLGDFAMNENGGWSRHLHLQILTELPLKGEAPIGYSTEQDFPRNQKKFPDPMQYFPNWEIR
jgi:murein DD-endopeptidase MepM/ murein hydrolase activator NlpD